ncbi:hypothetical protein ACFL50_00500 [Candidatus Latescibacterota bacterium]
MAEIIFLCAAAVFIIGFLIYMMSTAKLGSSGGSTTVYMGATHEMLNKDQQKAAEVVVEQNTGNKSEEKDIGEPKD